MTDLIDTSNCSVPKSTEEESKEEEEGDIERCYNIYREIISTLPKARGWSTDHLCRYEGFWFQPNIGLEGVMSVQQHFKPRDSDVLLATNPKSGTTWLKALVFSIINREKYSFKTHPLLTTSPHKCVPFLELDLLRTHPISNPEAMPSPRVLSTHIPFDLLPSSIRKDSNFKIVYIWRDPKDVFVSLWHFTAKLKPPHLTELPMQEAFELFCDGTSPFGPYWDHVLGYWNASLEYPERVMFLKYEDIMNESLEQVKRLAAFIGQSFSLDEEEEGIVGQILKLCSFEIMSNLEINKTGRNPVRNEIKNDVFFRQGKVGDWKNYLSREMIERIDKITKDKFDGSGLMF